MRNIEVFLKTVFKNDLMRKPEYSTKGSSGFDVQANLQRTFTILPYCRDTIDTGLFFAIPLGYELQARPRSGLAHKQGVSVLNTPGTIDSDYRGEIKIILCTREKSFTIQPGDRIAQLVLCPVYRAEMKIIDAVEFYERFDTERGDGGFGSTGV